jgi:predicted AlkP superfamily pyrophosphatase or phosphodiesterase
VVAVAACALATGCPRPREPVVTTTQPKLVVLIVVDQLPAWTLELRRPLLVHGFARLLREGVYWPRAEYPYAYTYTAPGHAALATGAPPRITGVVGNTWYRRAEGRIRPAEYDPDALVLYPPGAVPNGTFGPDDGASAKALRVPGIADALRDASRDSRSVAISLKSRSACFVAGQRPSLVLWFEEALGSFTTTTAYRAAVPTWVTDVGRAKPWSRFTDTPWSASDPAMLARETRVPDDAPGEGKQHGLGTVFPHDLRRASEPAKAMLLTPYGDELVTDLAIAALGGEHLGEDTAPDLLAISYSSHDFAGHNWGQGSWEQLDLLLRLDLQLGRLFGALDDKLGADGYAVVLTSDHGATPMIERSPHRGAQRIPTRDIEAAAEAAMATVLGEGDWIATTSSLTLYFSSAYDAIADAALRDEAAKAAAVAVRMLPGVKDAGRLAPLAIGCPSGEHMAPICESYVPGESGDIYLVPVVGSLITDYKTGTHHDAPSEDNRVVPLIIRAPGVAARTVYQNVSPLQVAPTIAALLGIPAPAAAQAPPLVLSSAAAKNAE